LFFHNEHLTNLIRMNNLAFILIGFQAVPLGLLQRDMNYRRLSIAEAVQALVLSVLTVTAAWLGFGYWSMVIGAFLGRLTSLLMVSLWKPIPFAIPRWADIKAPVRLGRQAAVGRMAWAFYTQSDGIIIGRVLGDSVLGVYRMAMNLARAPAEKVSTLIMRATGPLFAKVQKDPALVRRYLVILTEILTMIELPLMLGLGMVAPEAVQVVLGPKWSGLVVPLRWLVVFMTMRTLGTLMEQVLISQRNTRFTMRMSLLYLFVMPASFFFMAHWKGPSGVAASWVILAPFTVCPLVWKVATTIHAKPRELANSVLPAISGSAAMLGALFGLRVWLEWVGWPPLASLVVQVAMGGIVYGAVLLGLFRLRLLRYVRFLRGMRQDSELLPVGL
jgi:O-antigen/teichoic acid export membrane protein